MKRIELIKALALKGVRIRELTYLCELDGKVHVGLQVNDGKTTWENHDELAPDEFTVDAEDRIRVVLLSRAVNLCGAA